MKAVKILTILLIAISILPFVNAEIALQNIKQAKYNIADKVLIEGQVISSTDIRGRLDLTLKCTTGSSKIGAITVDITQNNSQHFAQLTTIPNTVLGKCTILAELKDMTSALIESKELDAFEVTNELTTVFDMRKREYQSGDLLIINGVVSRNVGTPVSGTTTITFLENNSTLFIDNTLIDNGLLQYTKDMSFVPEGEYVITIEVSDGLGNNNKQENIFMIKVSNKLGISINFDKNSYTPGDVTSLTGTMTSNYGMQLGTVDITAQLDNGTKTTRTLLSGTDILKLTYQLSTKIKSGLHNITITAKDKKGNYGIKEFEFNVIQIPTTLKVTSTATSYNPKDEIQITAVLKDQAGDPISDSIIIGLIKGEKEVISTKTIKSGTQDTIQIPDNAAPGNWKIRTEGFGLSDEIPIKVNEYKNIDTTIDGTNLIVKNLGNVPYNEELTIKSDDKDYPNKLNLDIGSQKTIDLKSLLPEGQHALSLPTINKDLGSITIPHVSSIFDGLKKLTGASTSQLNQSAAPLGIALLVLIVIGGLLYLVGSKIKKRKEGYDNQVRKKDYEQGQKMLDQLKSKGIRKDYGQKQEYGRATDDDIKDFQQRMRKTLADQEKQKETNEFLSSTRKSMDENKPRPGIFNMFN